MGRIKGFLRPSVLSHARIRIEDHMALVEAFSTADESAVSEEFLSSGYIIRDVQNREALDRMRKEFVATACRILDRPVAQDVGQFLDQLHEIVPIEKLNELRLRLYRELNGKAWFRPTYFSFGRPYLEVLVGNELAMQNRINLSIQMPRDTTSLLDIHADVFGGETPYQVVQWLPLVDVYRTKSMFMLPRPKSEKVIARMKDVGAGGMAAIFSAVEPDLVWLDIPYGKVLIFCPNFLHGNVVNEEPTTRWSLNCRFKGLFTPYGTAEKGLGSYYLPISTKPVTRLGMSYQPPTGFEE